jgi:hypothetical protein
VPLKRALFRDQMKTIRDRRKTVKLSMQLEPGREPPTAQEVQNYRALQAQHAVNMREREAAAAAERQVTKMRASGACSLFQVQTVLSEPAVSSTDTSTPQQVSKVPSQGPQGPSESVMQLLRCHDASNVLAKRTLSLKRFITAASTIIIRCWSDNRIL